MPVEQAADTALQAAFSAYYLQLLAHQPHLRKLEGWEDAAAMAHERAGEMWVSHLHAAGFLFAVGCASGSVLGGACAAGAAVLGGGLAHANVRKEHADASAKGLADAREAAQEAACQLEAAEFDLRLAQPVHSTPVLKKLITGSCGYREQAKMLMEERFTNGAQLYNQLQQAGVVFDRTAVALAVVARSEQEVRAFLLSNRFGESWEASTRQTLVKRFGAEGRTLAEKIEAKRLVLDEASLRAAQEAETCPEAAMSIWATKLHDRGLALIAALEHRWGADGRDLAEELSAHGGDDELFLAGVARDLDDARRLVRRLRRQRPNLDRELKRLGIEAHEAPNQADWGWSEARLLQSAENAEQGRRALEAIRTARTL